MFLKKYKPKNGAGFSAICKCDYCLKVYKTTYHLVLRAKNNFCCVDCHTLWKIGRKFSEETKQKIKEKLSGKNNPHWNGGKKIHEGYIQIYKPDHPNVDTKGYVSEHRLTMEDFLGRYLLPEEVVHHINGIRSDNSLENLELFATKSEHSIFHNKIKKERIAYE